jgi:hypothetical protein
MVLTSRLPSLAVLVLAGLIALTVISLTQASSAEAVTCPNANPVINENQCKGAGTTAWRLQNYNSIDVAGFPTQTSVNVGQSVTLKIARSSGPGDVDVRVFRMGYYGGTGGRLVNSANGVGVTSYTGCNDMDDTTGLENCNNWANAYTIPGSALATSGIYLVRFIDEATGHDNQAIFTVRDDARPAQILFKLPSATYQAYNQWTGKSLYTDLSQGANTISGSKRAVKVSFDRPLDGVFNQNNWFLKADYSMVYWLEQQGYDVAYTDSYAVHSNPNSLKTHKVVLLSGHDEYWSGEEMAAMKAARDAGVSIASFSANTAYWKVRYEGSGHTLVCYKTVEGAGPADGTTGANDWGPDGVHGTADDALGIDGRAGTADDHPENATTSFRDNGAPPGDPNAPAGGRVGPDQPENSLFGVMFVGLNGGHDYPLTIPAANGANEFAGDPIWDNTGISTGTSTTIGPKLVGFEWDAVPTQSQYTSRQPAGVKRLTASQTSGDPGAQWIQDEGRVYGPNPPPGQPNTVNAVKYTAASGARVFAAGTDQWAWGLAPHYLDSPGADTYEDPATDSSDNRIQQATYNILSEQGAEPGTPSGIVTGGNHAPSASFTVSPNPAQTGQSVSFNGSASSDSDGTIVKYQWDLDGNGTFETDTGTTPTASRTYTGTGEFDIRLRVTDNGGATGTTTRTLTVVNPGTSTYAQTILGTAGLTHYWRMGESSGATFADSKGSSPATNGGATMGVPGAIAGDPDKAARFDGVNDFASAPVDLSGTNTVSLEFWLKWNSYANDDRLAFEMTPNFNTNAGGFLVDPNESSSGKFELAHRQGPNFSGYNASRLTRPSAGAWHHYVLEFDKTATAGNELKAYVDGSAVTLTNPFSTDTFDGFANSILYFMSRAGGSLFGAGDLDEVALYDRALTAATVADHHSHGVAGNTPPTASFTASPNPADVGHAVSFDGSASSDPGGVITKYEWDLDGNGTFETDTGTTPTTSHTYNTPGPVTVGLRVTDDESATGTATKTVTIQNPPSTYAQTILGTAGLTHYWRMGESSGATFADSKGSSPATNGGATMGVPGAIAGDTDKAASFDGVNDFASANVDLSGTSTVSLEFWLKWDAFANDDQLAFEMTPNFNTNAGGFLVDPNESSSGKFELAHRQGGFFTGYNSGRFTRPTAGAWHHYVLVFDKTAVGANELKAFVDGNAVALDVPFAADNTDTFANSVLYFMSRAGGSLFGAGDVDEVAVYDRALTAAQAASHHTVGVGG